jgi:xanthine dehydrogenase molybdopterin-binding subunit B
LPKDLFTVADANTQITPNRGGTGGSITSEMVCFAVEDAASDLVNKLTAGKRPPESTAALATAAKNPSPDIIREQWQKAVSDAMNVSVLEAAPYLSSVGRYKAGMDQLAYETYCAACVEVEVDGLTGEYDFRHATVNFEGGVPFHGGIEIGQVEGSFVMGIGALTTEEVLYEPGTGRLMSGNTWTYKIPLARDLPADWNVELTNFTEREHQMDVWHGVLAAAGTVIAKRGGEAKAPRKSRSYNKRLLSGKASGEPPLLAAASVLTALRQAITAFGAKEFVQLPVPCTVETVRGLCAKAMADAKAPPKEQA